MNGERPRTSGASRWGHLTICNSMEVDVLGTNFGSLLCHRDGLEVVQAGVKNPTIGWKLPGHPPQLPTVLAPLYAEICDSKCTSHILLVLVYV